MHLKMYIKKYIINHTVQTRILNVSFLYTPVHVPGDHCKTKYTSSSHQVPANTFSYDCIHNVMKIQMYTLLLTQLKENYIMGRKCGKN